MAPQCGRRYHEASKAAVADEPDEPCPEARSCSLFGMMTRLDGYTPRIPPGVVLATRGSRNRFLSGYPSLKKSYPTSVVADRWQTDAVAIAGAI